MSSKQAFGRDEMNALFGEGEQDREMAAFRAPPVQAPSKRKQNPKEEPDLASMTAAETAAMLHQKSERKQQSSLPGRVYRSQKQMEHHALARELLSEQAEAKEIAKQRSHIEENEEEEEDEFVVEGPRAKAEPQVVTRRNKNSSAAQQRRKVYYSSSSSYEDEDTTRGRVCRRGSKQVKDDGSGTSSDEDDDRRRRRQRLLRTNNEQPEVTVPTRAVPPKEGSLENDSKPDAQSVTRQRMKPEVVVREHVRTKQTSIGQKISRPTASSSSSESSDSGSSSEESSSSSSEEEEAMAKPVFIPKNKRTMVQSEESIWDEEEMRASKEKERADKRKMESRAMVAKSVSVVDTSLNDGEDDDENGGATNAPPNDDDDVDTAAARAAWELRELERLLNASDEMNRREKERLEYERRRQMTDGEALEEDMKTGRYQAPGSNRLDGGKGQFMQRFYHRGAYYMDDDEWEESDIRHKAAEYARAATGEDKIDKSQLPEVMQVKGFGMARQNHRYRGLANEDTTDKRTRVVPLVNKKKPPTK